MATRAVSGAPETRHSGDRLLLGRSIKAGRLVGAFLVLISINSISVASPFVRPETFQNAYSLLVQKVHIIGSDDRWAEEEFSRGEHLAAQSLSGLIGIDDQLSGVVPMECFYTRKDHVSYSYPFNGVNICNSNTILINAHSLKKSICEDINNDFVCTTIPRKMGRIFFEKPTSDQFMMTKDDLCKDTLNMDGSRDVAILHSMKPLGRAPLMIGHITQPQAIMYRKILSVERNVGKGNSINENLGSLQFTLGQFFRGDDEPNMTQANIDSGPGSSGSPRIINQNGRILFIGINEGWYGQHGKPFGVWSNYTKEIYFTDEVVDFIKKNVTNADSCIEDVTVPDEVTP
jgi:hypothetical protein